MRQLIGGLALFATISLLLASAGCGDDDDGYQCREQCSAKRPYCGPDGSCVECVYNTDCGSGEFCNKDYECKGN